MTSPAGLSLDATVIPEPTTISEEARAALRAGYAVPHARFPAPDDKVGWGKVVRALDGQRAALYEESIGRGDVVWSTIDRTAPTYVAERADGPGESGVILYIHGGALVFYGGRACVANTVQTARSYGGTVHGVDYRMPPEHPFPAGLDDCLEAYQALLQDHDPGRIVVMGISAGGNLGAALCLKLADLGLPQPAGLVLLTPEVDLTESGDTFETMKELDSVLRTPLDTANRLYAGDHDLADPLISPLFGDFSRGWPRTFLQAGTRDLFLSNTVRMHRRLRQAGVEAELHVWEAMPHAGFGGLTPEDADMRAEVRRFLARCWG